MQEQDKRLMNPRQRVLMLAMAGSLALLGMAPGLAQPRETARSLAGAMQAPPQATGAPSLAQPPAAAAAAAAAPAGIPGAGGMPPQQAAAVPPAVVAPAPQPAAPSMVAAPVASAASARLPPAAASRTPQLPVVSVPTPPVKGLPAGAPPLVITGATYSANPGMRLLIVNNQAVREGADLGGGVQLRQIGPESAVLAIRGADYTVRY